MMPIWHHPDFKSGYLYLLISAKIFSIDAIARSSLVHARLILSRNFDPLKNIGFFVGGAYFLYMAGFFTIKDL